MDINWIAWIVVGLIAGLIAKLLMPGKDPGGCIITTLIGMVGAVVGGWIAQQLGWGAVTGFNIPSLIIAILGALLLLLLYRLIKGKKR